jgi:hypothetical protein
VVVAVAGLVRGVVLTRGEGLEDLALVPATEDRTADVVPSAFWKRKALPVLPVSGASAPAPVMVPLPKNERTMVPSVFVNAHVLPVSDELNVFVAVVPVTVSVAVAGAQESAPWSNVFVCDAAQFVLTVAANVPVASGSLPVTVPDAVAALLPKLVPVPASLTRPLWPRKCLTPWPSPSWASAPAGIARAIAVRRLS